MVISLAQGHCEVTYTPTVRHSLIVVPRLECLQASQGLADASVAAAGSEAANAVAEVAELDPALVTVQKLALELERRLAGGSCEAC